MKKNKNEEKSRKIYKSRKTNMLMCRTKTGLSRMQEWIFLNFSVKRSKFLTVKSFVKLSGYCIFYITLNYSAISLI